MESEGRKNVPVREPPVGDVVVVYEENARRYEWKPNLNTEFILNKHGLSHSANIHLSTGNVISRALHHLYPIGPPWQENNVPSLKETDMRIQVTSRRASYDFLRH